MKQALHIFRKELRRSWPLLLLWAGMLGLWLVGAWQDPMDLERLNGHAGLAESSLLGLAAAVGAALVVQQDGLIGQREFWMTRPVSPWSLMAAKGLFIALFLFTPAMLIEPAILDHYGLPPYRSFLEMADGALPWAACLAFAALVGSWTKGLPGFFILLFVSLLGPQFLFALFQALTGYQGGVSIPDWFATTVGLFAVVLIALQYRTRKRMLGALMGLAALPLIWMCPLPFDLAGRLDRALMPELGDMRIALTPGPGRETFAATRPERSVFDSALLWFVPAVIGQGSRSIVFVSADRQGIEWRDGTASRIAVGGIWDLSGNPAPAPGFRWAGGRAQDLNMQRLAIRGDEPFEGFLGRSGRLHAAGKGIVWGPADVRALSLFPGAEVNRAEFKARVVRVERFGQRFEIHVRTRRISNLRSPSVKLEQPRLLLANRSLGEVVPLKSVRTLAHVKFLALLPIGPFLDAEENVWTIDTADESRLGPDWLRNAEALLVFYDRIGTVDVGLEAPSLTVDREAATEPLESGRPIHFSVSGSF